MQCQTCHNTSTQSTFSRTQSQSRKNRIMKYLVPLLPLILKRFRLLPQRTFTRIVVVLKEPFVKASGAIVMNSPPTKQETPVTSVNAEQQGMPNLSTPLKYRSATSRTSSVRRVAKKTIFTLQRSRSSRDKIGKNCCFFT